MKDKNFVIYVITVIVIVFVYLLIYLLGVKVDENGYGHNLAKQPINDIISKSSDSKVDSTKITLSTKNITMTVGSKRKIYVTIKPNNASLDDLIWESSDPSIASVDSHGNVIAHKEGNVKITVKNKDGSVSAICNIEVKSVKVDEILLNPSSLTVKVGSSATVVAVIKPDNATNKELIWTSSDPTIATVDNNGKVTGVKEGTVIITAKTPDGKVKSTCVVNVVNDTIPATNIIVNPTSTSIKIGSSEQLLVTIEPENTTERDLIFTSSNNGIVTVDDNGKITGVGIGTAIITITTPDGRISTTCTVTVEPIAVEEIILNTNNLTVKVGNTEQLNAEIVPGNATNQELVWISSDPTVATVDNSGKVTGVSEGTVTITVQTPDGQIKTTCTVTVEDDEIMFIYESDEDNYIDLYNQFPTKDEVGKVFTGDKYTHDFRLKLNKNANGVRYVITIKKQTGSDMANSWAKIYLEADGTGVSNCFRSNGRVKTYNEYDDYSGDSEEKVLFEGVISYEEAQRGYKDFTLRMWMSEDVKFVNENLLGKTFKAKITVYAVA